eukprot:TRINITY_DN27184_c0_g1_i1.p1 TRINITY_DN27184_c0_g1~~TRINITY_DN27184_c0_g1_i1.p1  ORF type:complete len:318 (+),score=90.98 TRINITY_DN27184_c0_g1_i1:134-1087(+)
MRGGGFKNFLTSSDSAKRAQRKKAEDQKTRFKEYEVGGSSYRNSPITALSTCAFEGTAWCTGEGGSMQGWRVTNEDDHIIKLESSGDTVVMGMYDGHGGKDVSAYLAKHLHVAADGVTSTEGLQQVFARLDAQLREETGTKHGTEGSTCNLVKVTPKELVCANAGDCRAVLYTNGKSVSLSTDHVPEDPSETQRIEASGSTVTEGRVDGMLNTSRAFGDYDLKKAQLSAEAQAVTPIPDVRTHPRTPGADAFILQACDGIWGTLSDEEAAAFVAELLASGAAPQEIIEQLCNRCLAKESDAASGTDNMSINILVFKD